MKKKMYAVYKLRKQILQRITKKQYCPLSWGKMNRRQSLKVGQ